jgi:hypothetical protein
LEFLRKLILCGATVVVTPQKKKNPMYNSGEQGFKTHELVYLIELKLLDLHVPVNLGYVVFLAMPHI